MKEIEVNGKKYNIKEITYIQALELDGLSKVDVAKKMLEMSAGITNEESQLLTIAEGIAIQTAINDVNNLNNISDFQKPRE